MVRLHLPALTMFITDLKNRLTWIAPLNVIHFAIALLPWVWIAAFWMFVYSYRVQLGHWPITAIDRPYPMSRQIHQTPMQVLLDQLVMLGFWAFPGFFVFFGLFLVAKNGRDQNSLDIRSVPRIAIYCGGMFGVFLSMITPAFAWYIY